VLCDAKKRSELLAIFQELISEVKHSSTFKKLAKDFKKHPSDCSYTALIRFLRNVSTDVNRKLKLTINLVYSDDFNVPVWNSRLSDNTVGNSFSNYTTQRIALNNIIEYQIIIKANGGGQQSVNTTIAVYAADKTGSAMAAGYTDNTSIVFQA
jgi:hypothetical protein